MLHEISDKLAHLETSLLADGSGIGPNSASPIPLDPHESRKAIKDMLDQLQATSSKPDTSKSLLIPHSEAIR